MAQQQIITKPYVGELQDNDSMFINHDGALRQIKKSDADFASGADMRAEVAAREAFEAQEVAAREAFEKSETEARGQFETSVGEQISEKANVDGYYEEMTVGDAEQLVSTQFVEDSEPYLFRPTGGSHDVGNRAYLDKIVGGTVAWNQLVNVLPNETKNGLTYSTDNGKISITGTVQGAPTYGQFALTQNLNFKRNGSKYLILLSQTLDVGVSGYDHVSRNAFFFSKTIGTDWHGHIFMYVEEGETVSVSNLSVNIFDLTQMFGSTIADYIYSIEQSQAGAGVAWFKKLFPKDYYEYNAGELLSVGGLQSHDTVGFNLFDKNTMVVENVYIDNVDGVEKSNTGALSTGFIPVIPNTAYFINTEQTAGGWGAWYDADKNYISGITGYANADPAYKVKTAPDNAHYMRLTCRYNNNGNINTFCVNLSDPSRNGEYEWYVKHSYPLDSSLTLRGIPKLDASNNIYYDGDEYTSDGKVTRKYGVVEISSLPLVDNGTINGGKQFGAYVSGKKFGETNIFSNAFIQSAQRPLDVGTMHGRVSNTFVSFNSSITTVDEFKSAMSGAYLVYELDTPTTETAEPYQNIQIVDDFGTEEFVSNGLIPVGHNTRYPANLRDKLQHLPSLASSDGTYLIQQSGKQMTLVRMPSVFPETPTEDGTYTLKTVVTGGVATLQWVTE